MKVEILETAQKMGQAASDAGAQIIIDAIKNNGQARIIVATGASQFTVLEALTARDDIDWSCVTGFHLDEYLGLPMSHPASFRGYLKERLVDKVSLKAFHYLDGEADATAECQRVGELLNEGPIDVAFVGIGENGHLAFNDPPADFDTETPYLVVDLDEACRKQQQGEGWFPTLEDVPTQAISMSVKQIMKSKNIMCSVPDKRKAEAVRNSVEGDVSNLVPASILQTHAGTTLYLDQPAASLLK